MSIGRNPEFKLCYPTFIKADRASSDHLKGLAGKGYGAPFIYCTAITKQLLLRLQKKIHRLNHAKGVVECHSFSYLDIFPRVRREKLLVSVP